MPVIAGQNCIRFGCRMFISLGRLNVFLLKHFIIDHMMKKIQILVELLFIFHGFGHTRYRIERRQVMAFDQLG